MHGPTLFDYVIVAVCFGFVLAVLIAGLLHTATAERRQRTRNRALARRLRRNR